ncbi:MAG: hypothetical protein GF364_03255 [Candidatus Lokiarchaeota archaeon]|nr:hypothetical protein [Candidatus Lokiarchaeota archaeon]
MMNSLERVKAALKFQDPDNVPVFTHFPMTDVAGMPLVPSLKDIKTWPNTDKHVFPRTMGIPAYKYLMKILGMKEPEWVKRDPELRNFKWLKKDREEMDEWGIIWRKRVESGGMGHPGKASMPDWEDFDDYFERFYPDPSDKKRYKIAKLVKSLFGRKRYRMMALGSGPSHLASYIRGFNNYLVDHAKNPHKLKKLLGLITDNIIQSMQYSVKIGLQPHGFMIADDLGEQNNPFFSPRTFKKFYKDVYKTLFDEAHNLGCEFHLHSCGKVDPLLPSLIEWGLDAIEFDSPRMNGYKDLHPYRGKIFFWACVNIQSIYSKGTPEEVEREVWHMIRNLGTKHGGYGAYFYGSPRVIHVSKENIKAFKHGLKKYGDYGKIPEEWWESPVSNKWEELYVPPLPSDELG